MSSFGERFGQRILELRTDQGESQEEVAEGAFGSITAKNRISELETGKVARPQAKTVNALCAYFNISPMELAEIRRPRPAPPEDSRAELLEDYAKRLKQELDETRAQLEAAQSQALAERAEILEDRLADPEAALTEAEKTIEELRALLSRDGNEFGGTLLTRARDALDQLDYREAEKVFEEIEAREEPYIARSARAAYARGVVAELDFRWVDAAAHFARAAGLLPNTMNLGKAAESNWRAGKFEDSLGFASQQLRLAREYERDALANSLNNVAQVYGIIGVYEKAESLFNEALEIDKSTIGSSHPDYAVRLNNLANLYFEMGRFSEAEPLFLEALEIGKATIGSTHPDYAQSLNSLASLYQNMGRYDEAEPLVLEALEIRKTSLGVAHPDYAQTLNNLALLYQGMGRVAEALPLIEEALAIFKASLGEAHPNTQKSQASRDRIAGKVAEDDG